jgi:hypothetical protein
MSTVKGSTHAFILQRNATRGNGIRLSWQLKTEAPDAYSRQSNRKNLDMLNVNVYFLLLLHRLPLNRS